MVLAKFVPSWEELIFRERWSGLVGIRAPKFEFYFFETLRNDSGTFVFACGGRGVSRTACQLDFQGSSIRQIVRLCGFGVQDFNG